MVRSVILLLVGVGTGALSVWLAVWSSGSEGLVSSAPAPTLLRCEDELEKRTYELAELKRALATPSLPSHSLHVQDETPGERSYDVVKSAQERVQQANAWRISAIERFVPLSVEQKRRLHAKFLEDHRAQEEARESGAESLDDILGAEEAQVYRGQVDAAFKKVRQEEIEKDSVWIARKLGLSADLEQQMKAVFEEVELLIDAGRAQFQETAAESPRMRVVRMIADNKRRVELRAERLRQLLPPDQYQAYLLAESESSASDMAVFHGGSEGDSTENEVIKE